MDAPEWRGLRTAGRASAAHALLFTFTLFLVLKLHHNLLSSSWWLVFSPLWLFHIVVAEGRFSIPAPSDLDAGRWHPFHAAVATPLLIAFELLLCIYLECSYVNHVAVMNIHLVFLPVYLLESIIIIDNIRMWKTDRFLIYFFTTLSMVHILHYTCAIVDMTKDTMDDFFEPVLPSIGPMMAHIIIIAEVFDKAECQDRFRLYIGSHVIVIVPIYVFQVLLYMYLKGIPARARDIPIPYIFSPLFFLQGLGVVFSTSQLVERIYLLLRCRREAGNGRYFERSSRARGFLELMHHGLGFLGWWSIDEASKEGQARRIYHDDVSGCNPPDLVKRMSKKDLVDEVLTLQEAISKQIKATESTQQEYELLQYEKIVCRICLEREIDVVLLPCKHRLFCRQCCWTLWKCPYCSAPIRKRLCDSQSRRQQKSALSMWMFV